MSGLQFAEFDNSSKDEPLEDGIVEIISVKKCKELALLHSNKSLNSWIECFNKVIEKAARNGESKFVCKTITILPYQFPIDDFHFLILDKGADEMMRLIFKRFRLAGYSIHYTKDLFQIIWE